MKHIISVDPGKATGVCLVEWSGDQQEIPQLKMSGEVQPEEFAKWFETALSIAMSLNSTENISVVCERFTITAQTVRNSQAPYSLEQIGVLKHLCRINEYDPERIVFQSPVDAKSMFPNPTLKKVGIWHKGGEGHANDSIRHALLRLVKTGWQAKVLLD
jgi:hypothetical protein